MMDSGITPLTLQEEKAAAQDVVREGYVHRVLVAGDIFTNVLLGGYEDETISSRAARAALAGKWWGIVLSKFLDLFQPDHGGQAIVGDLTRALDIVEQEEASGDLPKETHV